LEYVHVSVSLPVFLIYCLLLVLSGVVLLASAIGGFGQRPGARIAEALFGGGFVAYGVHLLFFFDGGEFTMFYYAFVAPVLAVVHVVKSRRRTAQRAAQQPIQQFRLPQPARIREFGEGQRREATPGRPEPAWPAPVRPEPTWSVAGRSEPGWPVTGRPEPSWPVTGRPEPGWSSGTRPAIQMLPVEMPAGMPAAGIPAAPAQVSRTGPSTSR
jgi:hypothetical protein